MSPRVVVINDAECWHCGAMHPSAGLLPLCAKCTAVHAAAVSASNNDKLGTGIAELRCAVNVYSVTREEFSDHFTAEQLILIYRAFSRSEWDITPDRWTDEEKRKEEDDDIIGGD